MLCLVTVLILLNTHRQNAELVKLRQDVVRLGRELSERTDAQHAEDERRKALESKMAATEEQLAQVKVRERPLPFQGSLSSVISF